MVVERHASAVIGLCMVTVVVIRSFRHLLHRIRGIERIAVTVVGLCVVVDGVIVVVACLWVGLVVGVGVVGLGLLGVRVVSHLLVGYPLRCHLVVLGVYECGHWVHSWILVCCVWHRVA